MKLKKKHPKDLSYILGVGGTAKGCGTVLGIGVLTLQNMKKTGPIGSDVDPKNTIPGTTTVYFVTEDSVTALIKELTTVRSKMKKNREALHTTSKKLGITINAPNDSTTGHSDKRKQAPRTRAKR